MQSFKIMITRRNIRIKVMQALYAAESGINSDTSFNKSHLQTDAEKIFNYSIDNTAELFSLLLLYMAKIAQYAETDARNRSSKYLATDEDKTASIKIAGNTFLWDLLENETFKQKIKDCKLEKKLDGDIVKKKFRRLSASPEYQDYVSIESRNTASEKSIMKYLWEEVILSDEQFIDLFADEEFNWDEDIEMMAILFDALYKKPKSFNFNSFLSGEKKEYAHSLIETVLEKDAYLLSLIEPKFKNWDVERIAIVDLILLKMGVAELLYFETIPTKVTINEYIEVAKMYSTHQSRQFINGVLDNILKDLTQEGLIHKVSINK